MVPSRHPFSCHRRGLDILQSSFEVSISDNSNRRMPNKKRASRKGKTDMNQTCNFATLLNSRDPCFLSFSSCRTSHITRKPSSHFRPRSPINLFAFGTVPALEEGLAVVDERSGIAPSPVVLPSKRSQGATSAFRGVGPVLPPPIARRAVGGSGQSIVEAALEATLGIRCASD
jgi:hypothetical protein